MTEQQMVEAHRLGRAHAAEAAATIVLTAMKTYESADQQLSYLAGYVMELQRIFKKGK